MSCHFTLPWFCTVQSRLTLGTVEKGTAHGRAHKEPLSPPPCVLPGPARGEPTQVRCGRHIPCARLQSEVSTCSPKDNFQLAWKQTSKCLLSIPALPKEFENNLFPDHNEILLLQEKERREGERKGSTVTSQGTRTLSDPGAVQRGRQQQ